MEFNNIDISKLPADVRRRFKQLQVMHAEKKIQNKAKMTFFLLSNVCGPILLKAPTTDTLQKNLINLHQEK